MVYVRRRRHHYSARQPQAPGQRVVRFIRVAQAGDYEVTRQRARRLRHGASRGFVTVLPPLGGVGIAAISASWRDDLAREVPLARVSLTACCHAAATELGARPSTETFLPSSPRPPRGERSGVGALHDDTLVTSAPVPRSLVDAMRGPDAEEWAIAADDERLDLGTTFADGKPALERALRDAVPEDAIVRRSVGVCTEKRDKNGTLAKKKFRYGRPHQHGDCRPEPRLVCAADGRGGGLRQLVPGPCRPAAVLRLADAPIESGRRRRDRLGRRRGRLGGRPGRAA